MSAKTAFSPSLNADVTVDVASVSANSVLLSSFTVPGSTPDMVFSVRPSAALPTGIAIGNPYCVTAGTVVVPFINASGTPQDPASQTYRVIAY